MESITAQSFLSWHGSVRRRTRAVAERIPPEHLEARTDPHRFSPGDVVRHIAATERWMWGENVRCLPSRYPGHGEELASGHDAVLAFLDRMHRETADIVAGLGEDDLQRRCTTPGGVGIRVWKWLRLMVEHEVHHRGQLYEMLGRLGVEVPPFYGLTEPQVVAASHPLPPTGSSP